MAPPEDVFMAEFHLRERNSLPPEPMFGVTLAPRAPHDAVMPTHRLIRPRRRGRPAVLTANVADRIIAVVAEGHHLTTAAAAAGVARSTIYGWLRRAGSASDALNASADAPLLDEACIEFATRLAEARALAEIRAVRVVVRAMTGGTVLSERPAVTRAGSLVRDREGDLVYERTYAQPDGRLALAFLARAFPHRWGPSAQPQVLEAPPKPGASSEVTSEQLRRLSDRLHQIVAAEAGPIERAR